MTSAWELIAAAAAGSVVSGVTTAFVTRWTLRDQALQRQRDRDHDVEMAFSTRRHDALVDAYAEFVRYARAVQNHAIKVVISEKESSKEEVEPVPEQGEHLEVVSLMFASKKLDEMLVQVTWDYYRTRATYERCLAARRAGNDQAFAAELVALEGWERNTRLIASSLYREVRSELGSEIDRCAVDETATLSEMKALRQRNA